MWRVALRMLGCPERLSTCFPYTNYSQLRSALPCLCPHGPLHRDSCLYSVSSVKDLVSAFRRPEVTVNLANRGNQG